MKVSVIIVNFNGKNYLTDCLDSVLKSDFKDFEVIVVDNASIDGSARDLDKRVRLIKSKTNLFFTGGCNLGARKAKGEWLVFLNPDTVVEPDWLGELVKKAKEKKLTLQPKIRIYGTDKIDCVIGKYFWPGFGVAVGRGKPDNYQGIIKGDYANGTCLMINRNWFFELGGFDENFKFFYEDVDLQLRAKKRGGRAIGVMSAVIWHKGSLSFKQNVAADTVRYYYRRNRIITAIKNFKGIDRLVRCFGLMVMNTKAILGVGDWLMGKWFVQQRLSELIKVMSKKRFSLLDLGCGKGELVDAALEKEIKAKGIDKQRGGLIEKFETGERYDVISMYHVLEHVSQPGKVLKRVKKWLKPKGVLVVEVPLVGNLSERWLKKDYLAYWDKSHRYFFTKKELRRLLDKTGWRVIKKGQVWQQVFFHVITAKFKSGVWQSLMGLVLWLPLKLLAVVGLNEEMVRYYCVKT